MTQFNVNVLTLFPEMFPGTLGHSLAKRALENETWSINTINIRDFAHDVHKTVDDTPYGGGAGMVLKPDVVADAIDSIDKSKRGEIIYFSPRGKPLNQQMVREFAKCENITLICGRYEGLDQRVIDEYNMTEISIGDYILSGGELAAQVFIDTIVRLLDNVVNSKESLCNESFEMGYLEYPHFTRPETWRGRGVPEVLLSGHHKKITDWRRDMAIEITRERRPDLLKNK